ncbi:DNA-directed RNA polymerase subunit omega [bacterium]|nr:DNA-directed RNA polymerase subunit omega [bacterium]
MEELVIEKILNRIKNRFIVSLAAAKRARQLKDGAIPLIEESDNNPDILVALSEIQQDKIRINLDEPEITEMPEVITKESKVKAKTKTTAKTTSKTTSKTKTKTKKS